MTLVSILYRSYDTVFVLGVSGLTCALLAMNSRCRRREKWPDRLGDASLTLIAVDLVAAVITFIWLGLP